jgi:hemerythrin
MKKIALIESSNILMLRIEKLLKQYHLEIHPLKPTEGVVSSVHLYINDTDLLVLDLDTFPYDAFDFIKNIHKHKKNQEYPITLITSKITKSDLIKYATIGITDIITKPFNNYEFMAKILKYTSAPTYEETKPEKKQPLQANILVWDDSLSVHDDTIDQEHQMIIEKFSALYNYMKQGLGHDYYHELLDFLQYYVETHFEHEEIYQEQIQYPNRMKHKVSHQNFINQIETIIKDGQDKTVTNDDLIKISLFLKNWLVHHILTEDTKISEFSQK